MAIRRRALGVLVLLATLVVPVSSGPAHAAPTLPIGFREEIVYSGLSKPTNIEFAPNGQVFVAEKPGRVKVFDSLTDTTPTVFADLTANVHILDDRGLLGLAVHPDYPAQPWIYVLYTADAPPGQAVPFWNDNCDAVGGVNAGRCVVTGRLSRLRADVDGPTGTVMVGAEEVLVQDWCQQYSSHSMGDLHFGPDGALYVTAGDGASYNVVDYGQLLDPPDNNPCGDPPGGAMSPPTAEGGALRAQDVRTPGDPAGLDGALLRLDPATGAAMPGNPLSASTDPNARRVAAIGLRNPFRFTFRPGTNEVWIGDVGWTTWESLHRIANPTGPLTNFGWPCYQGPNHSTGYDGPDLTLCESLYADGTRTPPYFAYHHDQAVSSSETCSTGGSSITGLAFYPASGGSYPVAYQKALFFADYSRDCIWVMRPGADGLPDPTTVAPFVGTAANPVELAIGPGGDLFYVDHSGTVRRIRYFAGNQPPTAALAANPTAGAVPLDVAFSAAASSDPDAADQGHLSYAWDFTDDGTVDSTAVAPSFTYTAPATYTARLTVTDLAGASDTKTVVIRAGVNAPSAVIDSPTASLQWTVGQTVTFAGHASDPTEGTLPDTALSWQLLMHHCTTIDSCHIHNVQDWQGVASGSFIAPDHDYPSYLELVLSATDGEGITDVRGVRLDPRTVTLTFTSQPAGLQVTVGSTSDATPFTRTVIQGSTNTVSAPTPQSLAGTTYTFDTWSDGDAQTHVLTAPTAPTTYTAGYAALPGCADGTYTCATQNRAFVPADDTVLALTGDQAVQSVPLPFAMPYYGQTYSTAYVMTDGALSFVDPTRSYGMNVALPDPSPPNAAVYAFWDDLVVKAGTSTVRTATTGTAPNRQFVVEWRNVNIYHTSLYVSAEIVLSEQGEIAVNYGGISTTNTREQGDSATVGIENATGTVGLGFSVNQPVLRNNTAVVFSPAAAPPPTTGVVTGHVTAAAGGTAVNGATVTLTPGGRSTLTDATGAYRIEDVPAGAYTATATANGLLDGSKPVTVTAGGTHVVDFALAPVPPPPSGYTVDTASVPFVPAEQTVLTLTGDQAYQPVALPFAFPFWDASYGTAYVMTDGVLSFVDPTRSYGTNVALPDAAAPNAAIYGFWDDLVVKAGTTTVRTAVTGTAPNRQFVVEWRAVNVYHTSLYVTVEVILSENGDITVNYADVSASNTREQGDSATVGVENVTGTTAVTYSTNQPLLRNGIAVRFRKAPGPTAHRVL